MTEVVWSDTALDQLDAIGEYIDQFNPKAAADLADHLFEAGNSLEIFRTGVARCRGPRSENWLSVGIPTSSGIGWSATPFGSYEFSTRPNDRPILETLKIHVPDHECNWGV